MAILFNSFMYFPTLGPLLGPRPWHWLPICIYRPWPQLCIYLPSRQIFIYRPGQSRAWTCIYQCLPPICIYWPWSTIFITVLSICIYLLIYSSSSDSGNISNSSNFLGLDNTNISMPILAWRANLGV